MEEVASTATRTNLAQRPDRSHGRLRADLERDYEATFSRPVRNYLQGELLETAAQWLLRAQAHDGSEIERSTPQIARAWGYAAAGLTVNQIKDRSTSQIKRTLGYLREMGWIESWEPIRGPRGDYVGIKLRAGAKALSRRPEPVGSVARSRRSSSAGRAPVL